MIDLFRDISAACELSIPAHHRKVVGVIGAGGIVSGAHLPAYRKAGLPVRAITDINHDRAQQVAEDFSIPHVYGSVEELLADPEIEVVDIAVPVSQQREILIAALDAGKHVLAQKPLAVSVADAQEMADKCRETGLIVGVNQQLRFDEGIAAAHMMVSNGWVGEVSGFSLTVNLDTPWHLWDWALGMERLEILVHSIHYHDVVRWFLGEPTTVFAAAGRTKGQAPVGETRTVSTYVYDEGPVAVIHANHVNHGGDNSAEFRIDGSGGSIRGTLGLLYDYPDGRCDTLEIKSDVVPTDGWVPYPVTQRWIPDAFIGTMGSLLAEIAGEKALRSPIEDNVNTVALVNALYQSIDTRQAVSL
jgi:predicted dehydrogenase